MYVVHSKTSRRKNLPDQLNSVTDHDRERCPIDELCETIPCIAEGKKKTVITPSQKTYEGTVL